MEKKQETKEKKKKETKIKKKESNKKEIRMIIFLSLKQVIR